MSARSRYARPKMSWGPCKHKSLNADVVPVSHYAVSSTTPAASVHMKVTVRQLGKKMKEIQIDKEKVALDKIRKHQDQLLTLAACEHPEDVAEHRRRFDEHSQWAIAARSYENPAGFLNVTYHNITADETALQVVKLSSHQYRPRWLPHR